MSKEKLISGKLIVVKIGTSSLTHENGSPDFEAMKNLVDQIIVILNKGNQVVLVTSGAVAFGISELGVKPKPKDILFQQISAATGQAILMSSYRELFKSYDVKVAQILLSQDDLSDRSSYVHICDVLEKLLELNILPIINENDVTSTDELIPIMDGVRINFSDNDVLSALITNALKADLLIILSDVDGLYTSSPDEQDSKLITQVEEITDEFKELASGKGKFGRGGMKTKIRAAEIVTSSGIPMIISNSRRINVLNDIIVGNYVGTYFKPVGTISGRRVWVAFGASVKGRIKVNEGAKIAIEKGASLLAVGVTSVSGSFDVGDVVTLDDGEGKSFARGIVNYTSEEINFIKGVKTNQIQKILGYIRRKEIVMRKYMHLRVRN
jgi:glutamate 5-kinase